jgi:hypothetical protein
MNLTLWIVAGVLAVAFATGGVSKLAVPKENLAALPGGGWVEDFSAGTVKALGVLDLLAAAGLILPAALDIAPVLVRLTREGTSGRSEPQRAKASDGLGVAHVHDVDAVAVGAVPVG